MSLNIDRTYSDILPLMQVRKSWNLRYCNPVDGHSRITTPFRAVTNRGDFLGRTTNTEFNPTIPYSSWNGKYVYNSSDYIYYKKLRSMYNNRNHK